MNVNELIQRLRSAQSDVNNQLGQQLVKQGNDIAATIKQRVLQTQTDSFGKSFGGYSKTKIPAFFYYNTAIRANKGMNQIKKMSKNGEKLSYAGFRKLIGKTNTNKDFDLTGQLWMDWGVINSSRNSVRLGFKTQRSKIICGYNNKREGQSIIALSEKEKTAAEKRLAMWVMDEFNDRLR